MCDVQPHKLDIVLVPAEILNNPVLKKHNPTFLHLKKLVQMGSEATLLGDQIHVETDEPETAAEKEAENMCPERSTSDEKFLYNLYSDPHVIASEVAWFTTQEAAVQCSGKATELAEPDVGVAPMDSMLCSQSHKHEQVTAVVAGICAEEVAPRCDAVLEQYMYSLYLDAMVVASEVDWWMTQLAVVHCSDFAVELLCALQVLQSDGDTAELMEISSNRWSCIIIHSRTCPWRWRRPDTIGVDGNNPVKIVVDCANAFR
ncbi:hypothetical protein BJ741DRAFT_150186 [Chytriomyces cf. hyalinus JEL632]|nr:hypothetical protein BJ741DRAFT_150186 [Chytriomyces cf. hyalinus JEL632]